MDVQDQATRPSWECAKVRHAFLLLRRHRFRPPLSCNRGCREEAFSYPPLCWLDTTRQFSAPGKAILDKSPARSRCSTGELGRSRACPLYPRKRKSRIACDHKKSIFKIDAGSDAPRRFFARPFTAAAFPSFPQLAGQKSDRLSAVSNHPTKCMKNMGKRKPMSALPPKADMALHRSDVRFVPITFRTWAVPVR